jgi:hypothetical protein
MVCDPLLAWGDYPPDTSTRKGAVGVPTMRELRRARGSGRAVCARRPGLSLGGPGRRAAGTCTTASPGAWAGQLPTGTGCATWSRSCPWRTTWARPGWRWTGCAGRSIHTDPAWARPLGLLLSQHAGTTRRRSRCGSSRRGLGVPARRRRLDGRGVGLEYPCRPARTWAGRALFPRDARRRGPYPPGGQAEWSGPGVCWLGSRPRRGRTPAVEQPLAGGVPRDRTGGSPAAGRAARRRPPTPRRPRSGSAEASAGPRIAESSGVRTWVRTRIVRTSPTTVVRDAADRAALRTGSGRAAMAGSGRPQ